jgi:hypothetical protein
LSANRHNSAYKNLPGTQKLLLGGGMLLWGAVGLAILPKTEEVLDLKPDPKETARLTKVLPTIRAVDSNRDNPSSST